MKCPYCERRLFGRAFCPTHGKVVGPSSVGGGGKAGGSSTSFYSSINYQTNADVGELENSFDALAEQFSDLSASVDAQSAAVNQMSTKLDKVYVVGTTIWYTPAGWPAYYSEYSNSWTPIDPALAPAPSGWAKTGQYEYDTEHTTCYAFQIRFLGT